VTDAALHHELPIVDPPPAQPGSAPSRQARWQIIGFAVLLAAVVLILAATAWLLGWHIQTSDTQWCTFLYDVTRRKDISPALYQEFANARVQFGCVSG
jgi:hypothetical protein